MENLHRFETLNDLIIGKEMDDDAEYILSIKEDLSFEYNIDDIGSDLTDAEEEIYDYFVSYGRTINIERDEVYVLGNNPYEQEWLLVGDIQTVIKLIKSDGKLFDEMITDSLNGQ